MADDAEAEDYDLLRFENPDLLHLEIVDSIADELAAKQIHLSNQSVASQVRNGAFEGLTISETEEWNEYLDSLSQFSDDVIWDDIPPDEGGDEIPDGQDTLDRWGDLKVA